MACGSSDGSISILKYISEQNNWEVEKIPTAHYIGCNAVSWSPEIGKKRLVSGGCDNMVKIWSQDESGNWVAEANGKLEGHSDWVRDVAWAPSIGSNRSIIASCSQDRRVIIWTNEGKHFTPLINSQYVSEVTSLCSVWVLRKGVLRLFRTTHNPA